MELIERLVAEDEDGDDDLEGIAVAVDWRSEEQEIVESVSAILPKEDRLEARLADETEELFVRWRGTEYRFPLTSTRHDRYVAISSLAWLLRGRYEFWLIKDRLEDDTHVLVVLTPDQSAYLDRVHPQWKREKAVPLELGYDYFHDLQVPYLDHEDHNPDFAAEAKAVGDSDDQTRAQLQRDLENNPDVQRALRGFQRKLGILRWVYSPRFWIWTIIFFSWLVYRIWFRK